MGLTLTFYKQAATPDRVDKTKFMSPVGTVTGVRLRETTDLMAPTFILKTNPVVYNANYVFADTMGRYYYIDRVTALSGGRISIDCKIDVLHTYRAEILASSAWVDVASATDETSPPDYDMLHNDFPFRQDYDVLGVNLSGGTGWTSPLDTADQAGDKHIFLVLK